MRTRCVLVAGSCLLALVAACSGNSGKAADAPGGDAGDGTIVSNLYVQAGAICSLKDTDPLATCPVQFVAAVADSQAANVTDATVTLGPPGMPTTLVESTGSYHGTATGLAPTYHVSAMRGADDFELTFQSPGDFTMALSPSQPVKSSPASLTWTPANDAQVQADVTVVAPDGTTWRSELDQGLADSGSVTIPGTVLAQSGSYKITLLRENVKLVTTGTLPPGVGQPHGLSQISRQFSVTIP